MIQAQNLIELICKAYNDGWGVHLGQIWTAANQAAATREMTVQYGEQWIGRHVADCSGLGYWAFQQLGGYIYHGSNTIWKQYVTGRSELKDGKRKDGKAILPGDPVFLVRSVNGEKNRHHIGYYVGEYEGVLLQGGGTWTSGTNYRFSGTFALA